MTPVPAVAGRSLRSVMGNKAKKNSLEVGIYQHYKGGKYRVLGVAEHEATGEPLVVYRGMNGENKLWARPLEVFMENVNVNGTQKTRFTLAD